MSEVVFADMILIIISNSKCHSASEFVLMVYLSFRYKYLMEQIWYSMGLVLAVPSIHIGKHIVVM